MPLSNAITPAFRVRMRTFFRFSDTAIGFDARAIKKAPQPMKHSAKSLLKSEHARFCLTGVSGLVRTRVRATFDAGFFPTSKVPAVEIGLFTVRLATTHMVWV